MEVSMDLPNFTEQVEAPLPRWRLAMRSSSMGRPSRAAARSVTYWWEVPWKP